MRALHAAFPSDSDDHDGRLIGRRPAGFWDREPDRSLRRPLGITIIGGLIVSQLLTLFTTPVVYLYFDRWQHWLASWRESRETAPRVALRLGSEV